MDREEGYLSYWAKLMRGRVEICLWDSYLSFETRSTGPKKRLIVAVDQIVVKSIASEIG